MSFKLNPLINSWDRGLRPCSYVAEVRSGSSVDTSYKSAELVADCSEDELMHGRMCEVSLFGVSSGRSPEGMPMAVASVGTADGGGRTGDLTRFASISTTRLRIVRLNRFSPIASMT